MSEPLEILISSEIGALKAVAEKPHQYHVVSIRGAKTLRAPIDVIPECCLSMLVVKFEDLDDSVTAPEYIFPEKEHIKSILDYAQGKNKILVHCHAGISRSSAVAYVIACSRMSPEKAIEILNPSIHMPNMRIVRLGAELLGNVSIEICAYRWYREHQNYL